VHQQQLDRTLRPNRSPQMLPICDCAALLIEKPLCDHFGLCFWFLELWFICRFLLSTTATGYILLLLFLVLNDVRFEVFFCNLAL
jgi:hypothetical protein